MSQLTTAQADAMRAWRTAAKAYMAHAINCHLCKAAAQGHSQRCDHGLDLWADYQEQFANCDQPSHPNPIGVPPQ